MANNKSAEKRIRQNAKKRAANRIAKSEVKTAIRAYLADVKKNDKDAAAESLKLASKLMDTAARKKILTLKAVARKKSKLQKQFNELVA